jgi:hypothetical protein
MQLINDRVFVPKRIRCTCQLLLSSILRKLSRIFCVHAGDPVAAVTRDERDWEFCPAKLNDVLDTWDAEARTPGYLRARKGRIERRFPRHGCSSTLPRRGLHGRAELTTRILRSLDG